MRPIPPEMRTEMQQDEFYTVCCVSGKPGTNEDPLEWHHVWTYAGKQINEKWAIVPLKKSKHDEFDSNGSLRCKVRSISLKRATDEDLRKYPRMNWDQAKKYNYGYTERNTKRV